MVLSRYLVVGYLDPKGFVASAAVAGVQGSHTCSRSFEIVRRRLFQSFMIFHVRGLLKHTGCMQHGRCLPLRVQVPKHEVSTPNHNHGLLYRNHGYSIFGYFGPLGTW